MMAIALSTAVLALAAWFALRGSMLIALAGVLLSLAPLILGTTAIKAIFTWLALIGLIFLLAVFAGGLKTARE